MTVCLRRERMQLIVGDWLVVTDGIADCCVRFILLGNVNGGMAERFDQLIEFIQSVMIQCTFRRACSYVGCVGSFSRSSMSTTSLTTMRNLLNMVSMFAFSFATVAGSVATVNTRSLASGIASYDIF